jgi:hypothetical protein
MKYRNKIYSFFEKHLIVIIVMIVITTLIIVIEYILIPGGLITSDIGGNLITELIGIGITTCILDTLILWNDSRKWRKVKEIVYYRIGVASSHIFRSYMVFFKGGLMDWSQFNRLHDDSSDNYVKYMESILNGSIEVSVEAIKDVYKKPEIIYVVNNFFIELSDIQGKYDQFLSPEITEILLQIQNNHNYMLLFLEKNYIGKLFDIMEMKETKQNLENAIENLLKSKITDIMKDIYTLHKIGIKIF